MNCQGNKNQEKSNCKYHSWFYNKCFHIVVLLELISNIMNLTGIANIDKCTQDWVLSILISYK